MKKSYVVGIVLIVLVLITFLLFYKPSNYNPNHYDCPPHNSVDCMPLVPVENQKYCGADYRQWASEHCGTSFTE